MWNYFYANPKHPSLNVLPGEADRYDSAVRPPRSRKTPGLIRFDHDCIWPQDRRLLSQLPPGLPEQPAPGRHGFVLQCLPPEILPEGLSGIILLAALVAKFLSNAVACRFHRNLRYGGILQPAEISASHYVGVQDLLHGPSSSLLFLIHPKGLRSYDTYPPPHRNHIRFSPSCCLCESIKYATNISIK